MMMKQYVVNEFNINVNTMETTLVAEWTVVPAGLHNDRIIIQRIAADQKHDDIIKKVIKVEDNSEFVYKALKTKIKAIGGAEGLVDWMIKDDDVFRCRIIKLLNYAWSNMRYEFL